MLHDALEYAKRECRLPGINGERCVHALIESASCRCCVEVCPHNAWMLDDELLGLNAEQCDGCGLCAAVCPQGALSHEHQFLSCSWKGRQIAFSACEQAGLRIQEGIVPCLHIFSLPDLFRLYRQGHTDLVVANGDCNDCLRGNAPRVGSLLQHVNQMLESHELPPLRLQSVSPTQWQALLEKMSPTPGGPDLSRRAFLGHAIKEGISEGVRLAGLAKSRQHGFIPSEELLSGEAAGGVIPNVPFMDAERCDGCDACVKVCPHEAIKLSDINEDALHYHIEASRCTGCKICVDVCGQHAISLQHWVPSYQKSVSLKRARCRRCGAPCHMPDQHHGDTGLCGICTRVNHYRNLYQVLD